MMAAPPRNRRWVWFFVVLGLVAILAVGISWVYHARQQLTLEELHRQRARWDQAGPRDYLLEYRMAAGKDQQYYVVQFRNGRVESAVRKGQAGQPDESLRPDQYGYYSMPGLFDLIERNLEQDAQPRAPRASNQAEFDPDNGHLIFYQRHGGAAGVPVVIRVMRFEPGPPH
jgi:hypothetical protein